jgi:hypothetical protein
MTKHASVSIERVDPKKLEVLKSMLKTEMSSKERNRLIKTHTGGTCLSCTEIPTINVIYDISDPGIKASRIERYCDECYEKNKIQLTATNGERTIAVREYRKSEQPVSKNEYKRENQKGLKERTRNYN